MPRTAGSQRPTKADAATWRLESGAAISVTKIGKEPLREQKGTQTRHWPALIGEALYNYQGNCVKSQQESRKTKWNVWGLKHERNTNALCCQSQEWTKAQGERKDKERYEYQGKGFFMILLGILLLWQRSTSMQSIRATLCLYSHTDLSL